MIGSLISVLSSGFFEAFTYPEAQINDIFNEVVIVLTLYSVMCFSGFVTDALTEFNIGYVSCLLIVIHLVVNLSIMVVGSAKKLVLKLKRFFYQRKLRKQKSKKVTSIEK